MTSNIATSKRPYKVVGTQPVRHDGIDKVTGKALYGADIQLPGLLHGKVLRSPHAHAGVRTIDTSRAEAHPEVKAVATAYDFATPTPVARRIVVERHGVSQNVLAREKVLYKGHAVVAVAATSPHVAEEALSLIEVDYEPLEAVTTLDKAMKPGAPLLHEHWTSLEAPDDPSLVDTNIAAHDQHSLGDIDQGFKAADVVIEREFTTKTVHQGYIEPQNATAWWAPDGRVTIWCSSQGHFGIQENTARILGLPLSDVKVVPMEIGGGFGGKLAVYLEPIAAVLSRKSGHPVKLTMSRTEVLEATGPASGSYVRVKIGTTKEGRITAGQAYFALEAGAFPGAPLAGGAAAIFAPYDIENVLIDAYDVVDNKPRTSAYRAPGGPNVVFPVESLVDELAEQLGMDPMEFRLLNAASEGTRRADGLLNRRIGAREVMEALTSHPHYSAPLEGENRGRGVAMGCCLTISGMSCVVANVLANGTVSLVEGSVDIGGSRTAVAQQLADVLGIPVEDVIPQVADTDTIGYTSTTGGSAVAFKTGIAACEAANDVKRQLVERAARVWDVSEGQVDYVDGVLRHVSDESLRLNFREIAAMLPETGGPVVGRGNVNPGGAGSSYSANIVDLEVDPDTGKVTILRYTAFQDVGTAIHPGYVEGQIQGGTAQGIGWALNEEYFMGEDGSMLNASLLDYRMPTSLDLPAIEAVIVEVPNASHPFGVRGVGESNIVPPLAAIANAIHDAVGVRMNETPMNPAAVVRALKEKSSTAGPAPRSP